MHHARLAHVSFAPLAFLLAAIINVKEELEEQLEHFNDSDNAEADPQTDVTTEVGEQVDELHEASLKVQQSLQHRIRRLFFQSLEVQLLVVNLNVSCVLAEVLRATDCVVQPFVWTFASLQITSYAFYTKPLQFNHAP